MDDGRQADSGGDRALNPTVKPAGPGETGAVQTVAEAAAQIAAEASAQVAAETASEIAAPRRVLPWPTSAELGVVPIIPRSDGWATRQSPVARLLHAWHLLSLDAPTIAALWTWFIALAVGVSLAGVEVAAMAVAVWLLYAADRLLDARSNPAELEARHHFHQRHRPKFLAGIVAAALLLAVLLPRLPHAAIDRYLILGALLAGWFVLIHARRGEHRLPKELAVGVFFPAAVFIPTIAHHEQFHPDLRLTLLPYAVLFAAVCCLNCLAIYAWEHRAATAAHWTTRRAMPHLPALLLATFAAAVVLAAIAAPGLRMIPVACALTTAILFALNRYGGGMARLTLRAAADAALLTPLLLLPWLLR